MVPRILFAMLVPLLLSTTACADPLGIAAPSTQSLERDATAALANARSVEIAGVYDDAGSRWSFDADVEKPNRERATVKRGDLTLEAVAVDSTIAFEGPDFIASQVHGNAAAENVVKLSGVDWWAAVDATGVPWLVDFTDGAALSDAFFGVYLTHRTDNQRVGTMPAIKLSGPNGDVYVAANPPHRVLRIKMRGSTTVDGLTGADLAFSHYGAKFDISLPRDAVIFTNPVTLPPIYSVESVATDDCGTACRVTATVKNLGGLRAARAPSTVTFLLRTPTGTIAGQCTATIAPDVGTGATTIVGCTIAVDGTRQPPGTVVTATPENPGR